MTNLLNLSDPSQPTRYLEFLESIYINVESAIFVIDVTENGRYLLAGINPAHERLSGMNSKEVTGCFIDELTMIPPEALTIIESNYDRCVNARDTITYEEVIPIHGRITWWLTRLTPLFEENGRIYRIIGTSVYINERKEMEEALRRHRDELEEMVSTRTAALRESEEQYRQLVTNIRTGIIVCDPNSVILFTNPEAERLLRQPQSFLLGKHASNPIWRFIHQDGRSMSVEDYPVNLVITTGRGLSNYIVGLVLEENKPPTWVQTSAYPTFDNNDNLHEIIITFVDITPQIEAEIELTKQAQKLAESNLELEQFAYVASHDLQEPLRMVAGFLGLLERRYNNTLDDTAREYVQFAVDGAKRMKTLIDDLLRYSRVNTQASPLMPVASDDVWQEVVSILALRIEEKNACIHSQPLPRIMADRGQLSQLFQNLLSNALKFCHADAPKINIWAERDNDMWRFAIQDNGIGFSQDQSERIFQIFQRLHARDEYSGTGIGLAICLRIVQRHGGKIWAESEPDKGSTFYFTLPDVMG